MCTDCTDRAAAFVTGDRLGRTSDAARGVWVLNGRLPLLPRWRAGIPRTATALQPARLHEMSDERRRPHSCESGRVGFSGGVGIADEWAGDARVRVAPVRGRFRACGHSGDCGSNAADTANTPAASAALNPSVVQTADTSHLTDANILAEEEGGDSAEVAIATFVRAHSASATVKAYATTLVNDYGKSLRETHSLADSLAEIMTPSARRLCLPASISSTCHQGAD